jgi:transcriptional regulator
MLILRVIEHQPRHGYAIARRIADQSGDELSVEEGSLYPALQKLVVKGWVKSASGVSETGRSVRVYRITPLGRKQLGVERANYRRTARAIGAILGTA